MLRSTGRMGWGLGVGGASSVGAGGRADRVRIGGQGSGKEGEKTTWAIDRKGRVPFNKGAMRHSTNKQQTK